MALPIEHYYISCKFCARKKPELCHWHKPEFEGTERPPSRKPRPGHVNTAFNQGGWDTSLYSGNKKKAIPLFKAK